MKISRLFTIFAAFAFMLMITSCATTHPNEKLLVGTWYTIKAAPTGDYLTQADLAAKQAATPKPPKSVPDTVRGGKDAKSKSARTPEEIEADRAQKLQNLLGSEQRSKLIIRADKTADKVTPGKTVKAKWKLKKDGTRLIAKSKEKGKFVFDIQKLTDSTMMVTEHLEKIDLVIKYRKVQ